MVLPLMALGCGGGSGSGGPFTTSNINATPVPTPMGIDEAVDESPVLMSAPLPAAAPLIAAMKAILKRPDYERQVLWPYRDSAKAGNITIGVGHLVPNKAAFLQLGLTKGGVAATPAQKGKAWDDLLKAKVGMDASKYQTVTNLQISQRESDALLAPDVEAHIRNVNAKVSGFFSLPFAAQIGLTDIDYNVKEGISKFPSLIAAVKNKNWPQAYLQSHRIDRSQSTSGIGVVRNQQIMSLFLAASQNLAISSTTPNLTVQYLNLKISGSGDVAVKPDSFYTGISPKEKRIYTTGVKVDLTAQVGNNAKFGGWQGDLGGTNPSASLTMSKSRSVTATFSTPFVGKYSGKLALSGTTQVIPITAQIFSDGKAVFSNGSDVYKGTINFSTGSVSAVLHLDSDVEEYRGTFTGDGDLNTTVASGKFYETGDDPSTWSIKKVSQTP